jgi:hypothetical protein
MNPYAIAFLASLSLFSVSFLAAAAARALDEILHPHDRALFCAGCFLAGFCSALSLWLAYS